MLLKLVTQFLLFGLFGGIGGLIAHFTIQAVFGILGYTTVSATVADVIIIFLIILEFSLLMYLVQALVQGDLNNLHKVIPPLNTIIIVFIIGIIGSLVAVYMPLSFIREFIEIFVQDFGKLQEYTIQFFIFIFAIFIAMTYVIKEFRPERKYFSLIIFSFVYYLIHDFEFETIIFEWFTESLKWIIYGTIIGMSSQSIVLIKYLTVDMHERNNQKSE